MALFLQGSNGDLVRDCWNYSGISLHRDNNNTIIPLPVNYEAICNTLLLQTKASVTDPRHTKDVLVIDPNTQQPITAILRLQGFLKDPHLGPYGDWDGRAEHCMTALSSAFIEPPSPDRIHIWRQTWITLRFIRRWLAHTLGTECRDNQTYDDLDAVRCTRRIFSKTDSAILTTEDAHSLSHPGIEHPLDHAAAQVQRRWVTDRRLSLGIRRSDGKVTRGHPVLFQTGDFVDIAISFDPVERYPTGFNLYLRLEHVVQLVSYDNIHAPCIREVKGASHTPAVSIQNRATIEFAEDDQADGP